MKITFFIGSVIGGGAEHVVCELASYFCEQSYDCEILTVTRTQKQYKIDDKVKLQSLDRNGMKIKNGKIRLLAKMWNLFMYLIKSDTDCYVVFLPETIQAITFFKRFIKVPIILSERNNPKSYSNNIQRKMCNCFKKADGIVFQTNNARDYYRKYINELPLSTIIPNAILVDLPNRNISADEKTIVSVGRFNKQKNFELLINAFAIFFKKYNNYTLILYGEGELKKDYEKIINDLNVSKHVKLPGYIPDVAREICDASMFVMSSDFEGIPNALIEAMAIGIPSITTDFDGGAARLLIENRKNGLVVPKNDVTKLVEAMIELAEKPEFANEIGENAKDIRERLSKKTVFPQWLDFIEKVTNM